MKAMLTKINFFVVMLSITGIASAEGGCPRGQTPRQYGSIIGCAPGGNDDVLPASSLPPSIHPNKWIDGWGAIAAGSDKSGPVIGLSLDQSSKHAAVSSALQDCKKKSGANCKIDLEYRNQCAAIVAGENSFATARGASKNEAVHIGEQICVKAGNKTCNEYYTACSYATPAN